MFGTFKKPRTGAQGAGLAAVGDGAAKVNEAQFINTVQNL